MNMRFKLLSLMVFLLLTGCTSKQQHEYSHWKSDLIGLNRQITLFSTSGRPIKTWQGRYKVEVDNGVARFIHDGKAIIISGTFLIEEIK